MTDLENKQASASEATGETVQVAVPAGTHTLRIESITR